MSLEQQIAALIVALDANTAALIGGKAAAQSGAGKAAGKPDAGKAKGPKNTPEATCALLNKIKDAHGLANAREVLKACGLEKMVEVDDKNSDAVFAAAKKKFDELNAAAAEETEAEDDSGL